MKKYTMKDFINGKFAVSFDNEADKISFLNACDLAGIRWIDNEKASNWYPDNGKCSLACLKGKLVWDYQGHTNVETEIPYSQIMNHTLEIHITTNGIVTNAVLKKDKKVVRRSKAVCSTEDVFEFPIGAKIAFDRLFEDDSKINVGDWVEVVSNNYRPMHNLRFGQVLDVKDILKNGHLRLHGIDPDGEEIDQYVSPLDVIRIKKVKRRAKVGEYVEIVSHNHFRKSEIVKCNHVLHGDCCRLDYLDNHDFWYASSNKYVVLDGYQEIKPKKKVLRLEDAISNCDYGVIGESTNLTDINGVELYVGDTVEVFNPEMNSYGDHWVCKSEDIAFIQGHKYRESWHTGARSWRMIKRHGYRKLKAGNLCRSLKVVEVEE